RRARGKTFLDVILLQIDEGGPAVAAFGQQIELVHKLVAMEHLADAPAHALLHEWLRAAEAVENLQRALRPADRARADTDGVILIEHHGRNAALAKIDRGNEPDGSRAHHDDRVVTRRAVELGAPAIGI